MLNFMRTVYLQLWPHQSQQKVSISTSMYLVLANANRTVTTRVQHTVALQRVPVPHIVRTPANQPAQMNVAPYLWFILHLRRMELCNILSE